MANKRITTLQELANFINESEYWDNATIGEAIYSNGWTNETHKPNGIARNGKEVCYFDENLLAKVA